METVAQQGRRSVSFRVPAKVLELVDVAREFCHKDRTEFVVDAMHEKAAQVLHDQTLFKLSVDDYKAFLQVLDNPPEPTECLKALARKKPIWER